VFALFLFEVSLFKSGKHFAMAMELNDENIGWDFFKIKKLDNKQI
jgi:hypothetical protein